MTPESGYFEDDLMLYFLYKDVGNGVFPCSFIDIKILHLNIFIYYP